MSVYFARVKGYVKIGYSSKPYKRILTIATGTCLKPEDVTYGDDVDLLGWVPGDRKVERAMHMRFADLHVVGEWFWDADDYDALIEADPFGVPWHDTPWPVVSWMGKFPDLTREQVTQVYNEQVAKEEAARAELRESAGMTFEWIEQTKEQLAARRREDRAFWRAQRAAA